MHVCTADPQDQKSQSNYLTKITAAPTITDVDVVTYCKGTPQSGSLPDSTLPHLQKILEKTVSAGTFRSFTSDGHRHLSTKSPRYGDMAFDSRVAITCLAVLALTLRSAAVHISISLPSKTYTALPDIFDINCVAFSSNSSGVFQPNSKSRSLWRENCSYVSLAGHSFASAPCRAQMVCLNVALCGDMLC